MADFSDAFTRADSTNLGANWTEANGDWSILSNQLRTPGTAFPANPYYIVTTTTAHAALTECRVTITYKAGASFDGGPLARRQSGADTYYYADFTAPTTVQVYRRVAGVDTAVGAAITLGSSIAANDTLGLDVSGTGATVTLKVFRNGVQQSTDRADSSASRIVTAGQTGILMWSGTADLDDFAMVDNATPPPGTTAPLGMFDPEDVASTWYDPEVTTAGWWDWGYYESAYIPAAGGAAAVSDVPMATMIPMALMAM